MVNLRTNLRQRLRAPSAFPSFPSLPSSLRTKEASEPTLSPGLHTYRIDLYGGQRRVHLRVDPDGSGVLFRDVTDVIHLNATAAGIAYLALEGLSQERARRQMQRTYGKSAQLDADLASIYELVAAMTDPGYDCPTCALPELPRADLFSTPVHAPYKVDLAITYGCNNECPHCYNEPTHYPMASLSKEHWFEVIDRLHELGVPHLIFTGGEATLHPDLCAIIDHADKLGHVVGLNSNGRRMAHAPYVAELAAAGLNHVQITLGSSRPAIHDAMMGARSFDQTVKGIRNAVASPLHTITNTTLMQANKDHAEEIIEFLYDLGIRTFAMNGMIYSGGGFGNGTAIPESEMPALLIRVRDRAEELGMRFLWYTPTEYCRMSPVELELGAKRCNAGEYSLCIEPNGDVLPCQSYYVAAGNILRDPWEEIWQGALFRSFRDRVEDPRWAGLPEKCWECPDLPLCGGGCRIEREARDGNRIADSGHGGGCAGCSGSCGTGKSAAPDLPFTADIALTLLPTGFVPPSGQIDSPRRGSGVMVIGDH